jgi:RimJ/RimL family protein N-acetyltransferase
MDLCAETVRVSDRVILRPLMARDAGAIVAGLSDWAVTQWLTRVPFPYALADAEWFIGNEVSRGALGIIIDGVFAGVVQIGTAGELGYWLAPACQGKGMMTLAAHAVVAAHFDKAGGRLISDYHVGNEASCNVLEKLGFRVTGHVRTRTARGEDVVSRCMTLSPQDWQNRLWIMTPRLVIRPLRLRDAPNLIRFGGLPDVARMLGSVPSPWPLDHAEGWIAKSVWTGKLGFRLGVWLQDGTLIGMVGLGGAPMSAAYFIDPGHAARGYATEAMQALLTHVYARFDLDEIVADHFTDNPASGRVLQKLGFQKMDEGMGKSLARLEPAPVVHYRLTKARFESLIP